MPTDIEEQVAAYFAWIERRSGVELRPPAGGRVLELHPPPGPSRRRWAAGAGLIATAAAVIAVLLIVDRPANGPSGPVDTPAVTASTTPATTAQPPTTTVESTTPPSTATAPTTTPATTPPTTPATTGSDVLSIDLPPYAFPIDGLAPCEGSDCPAVASAPDGTLVAYDAATNSFWIDGSPPRTVPVIEPLNSQGSYLIAVGPDDVAYVAVSTSSDPIGELVLVALSGDNAGQVLARPPVTVDLSGDSDLVPTAEGLVVVGCCGAPDETVRPDPDAPVLIPWMDRTGASVIDDTPHVSIESTPAGLAVVRDDTLQRWAIPGVTGWMRGMPETAARVDGGVTMAFYDVETSQQRLYVFKTSGTVEELEVAGAGMIVALDPFGSAVAHDGQAFQRWSLPTYTEPRDAMESVPRWLGGADRAFGSVDDVIDAVVATLSEPDGCERPPSATVLDRTDSDPVQVTIDHRSGCDDSVGGALIELTIASNPDWTVVAASQRDLCIRGGGPDLCI